MSHTKINVRKQGSRWRWTLFVDGKIADSGSTASKSEAERDVRAAKKSKMRPTSEKPKRTPRRKSGWILVSKPHRTGSRKYRYRRKGPRAEAHYWRDGKWYTVRSQSVLDYFFAALEGRAAKWPYEVKRAKRKVERKTKSEGAALSAAIRRAK